MDRPVSDHPIQAQFEANSARQRAILESAIDFAVVATDPTGIVTDWNSGAANIMGWTADEMCGRDLERIFTPDDRAAGRIAFEMRTALEKGRANDERWHLRKDGQRFWASGEMMPLHEDGKHTGFVKIMRNRTEHHAAAVKQQADAAFMQSVLASSADCIKVLDLDAKITFMTEGGMKIMEISDFNSVRGCPWPDFWAGQGNLDAKAALAAAQAGEIGHFQGTANTYLGTPKWWDVQVTAIRGPDGKPNKLLAVSRDISDLKAAQSRLAASEARWRGLFDSMQEGFFIGELMRDESGHAFDYRFLVINPAFSRQSGLSVDATGRTVRSLVPDIDQWVIDKYAYAVETGTPVAFEIDVPALSRSFEVRASKEQDDRFSCLFLDVTARKQAEERQDTLNRELSHRMKNMLAMVQAVATQTLRNVPDLDAGREALSSRLVAMSRAHDLLLEKRHESATLGVIVAGALAIHDDKAGRLHLDGPSIKVGSKAALSVALMINELATNAAKYGALSTAEGRVAVQWQIDAAEGGPMVRLCWIETNGPPVSPPERRGFGTRLIERGVAGAIGATVDLHYPPEGVICELTATLAEFQADE